MCAKQRNRDGGREIARSGSSRGDREGAERFESSRMYVRKGRKTPRCRKWSRRVASRIVLEWSRCSRCVLLSDLESRVDLMRIPEDGNLQRRNFLLIVADSADFQIEYRRIEDNDNGCFFEFFFGHWRAFLIALRSLDVHE